MSRDLPPFSTPTTAPWERRTEHLLGRDAMKTLKNARVTVFGLGGVGSFCVEALVRSSIGHLRVVDHDCVGESNRNRQLHAMSSTIGMPKVEVMQRRARDIHPTVQLEAVQAFFAQETAQELLSPTPDLVVDAIDALGPKVHLLEQCVARGIAVVSAMGAAGRVDPTQVRVAALADTHGDPLACRVRKLLRRRCSLDGVLAVFSVEPPAPLPPDQEPEMTDDLSRGRQRMVQPSMVMVPAAMGLAAASVVVRRLLDSRAEPSLIGS